MIPILLILLASAAYANEEATFELPGGATMDFVWIEPGTFTSIVVGPPDWIRHEQQITITKGFYLGKYEVTQEQWKSVMGADPWDKPGLRTKSGLRIGPTRSAVYESWIDCHSFIARLNEGVIEERYRLPTQAEWEYACRAGTSTEWSFGDDESELGEYAWYFDNTLHVGLGSPQPAGMKRPNPWGLYDMHGNVFEYCRDGEVRGGSGPANGAYTTSAYQHYRPPSDYGNWDLGLRLLKGGVELPAAVTPQTWGQIKNSE